MINKTRSVILIVSGFIIIFTLFMTFTKLQGQVEKEQAKPGFTTLLAKEDITCLVEGEKVIYAGGVNGLFSIDKKTFETKEIGDYHYLRSLLLDARGLWLATDTGLVLITAETSRVYTKNDGLPDDRVLCINPIEDGHFWLGTWGGAIEMMVDEENKSLVKNKYTSENGLLTDNVNVINQDNFGGLWFGSYVAPRGGVSVLKDGTWQYFTVEDALLHGNITTIINRFDEQVIVGGGLFKYGGATVFKEIDGIWAESETLTRETGLAGEKVRTLYEDQKRRLWVGSEYDGLVIIENDHKKLLNDARGLSHNEVKVIREDEDGNIWIGTMRGLTRIEKGVV